jgi:hypothetical protein
MVTNIDGDQVSNYSPGWIVECLAKDLLGCPLRARRARLSGFDGKMHPDTLTKVKNLMVRLYASR